MPILYFTVTNDISYDQRMQRICSTLADAGYTVTLVGRKFPSSKPLPSFSFNTKRLKCFFQKGKLFYAEYNFRLFIYLLSKKMDGICAIDLDTILPCYYISILKKIPRIYDAHELFCEMKEIVSRPAVYRWWKKIEKKTVPAFIHGYTVNRPIADEFRNMYGVEYEVIRNIPKSEAFTTNTPGNYLLYQGDVNEGRAFETLIPAMKNINMPLWIAGDGNFLEQAKELTRKHGLENKIVFKGKIPPPQLKELTRNAFAGFTLFESGAMSNYYSLANRFFDYMHAGLPQVCVNYPVYEEINTTYPVAILINNVESSTIAGAVNSLLENPDLWNTLHTNALEASKVLNWQNEQLKLIAFYRKIYG